MRSIIAISALALTVGLSTPASAQYRHYHYHGGGGNWAGPLVGGLIVGGMLGAMASQPRYYDSPPVIVQPYHTECQMVPVYDRYGYYRGERRECYQVPN